MRVLGPLFIVAMLIFTGSILLDENMDGVSSPSRSLSYYHNAYVNADLTHANGSPAEGFLLKVQPVNAVAGPIEGTSGPDGIVLLNISHYSFGPSFIWVEDGSGTYRWRGSAYIEPDGEYEINITVEEVPRPFTRVTGYIRNGSSGAPLEGYTINVVAFDHLGNMEMYTDQSDPQGRYILRVPNTTLPCQLSISGMGEFYFYTTSFQPEYQQEQFDLDIKMLPLYVPDVPVKLTYRNASTGEKLSSGKLRVYGHNTDLGHQTYSRSNLMPDGSGDYSLLMGPGEYRARWGSYLDPYWMVEYDVTSNFYVGSSTFTMEVPLDMPGLVPVELEVWNGTGPLYNTIVSYSHTLDTDQGDIEVVLSYKPTNLSGKLFFGAPEDTLLDLTLHRGGYVTGRVPLNTTGASGTIYINATMDQEEVPAPRPRGNLSVTVVDEVTGIPLPDVRVMAYRDLNPGIAGIGSYTDDNGELVMELLSDIYDVTAESSLGKGEVLGVEVYEGMITEVTIYVERYDPVPEEYGYTVHVKDEGGDPLPNQLVSIECRDLPGYALSILSDNHGNVSFVGPRGTYLIYLAGSNPSSYGPGHSSPYRLFELSGEGGSVPDIIGYPAAPMVEVQGFVYDSGTMDPMAQVQITATSVKDVGGTTRNGAPEDLVHLDTMNVGSTSTGFYRAWGKDTLVLEAFEEGYFPYYEEMDISTMAPGDHDILMEELVDFDILVNGTLLDQDGGHIPGTVLIYDRDHPGFLVGEVQVNSTGEFAFYAYIGNFTAMYNNATLQDEKDFQVEGSNDNIHLYLIPLSAITGTVQDAAGSPIVGLNVTLVDIDIDGGTEVARVETSEDGTFEFEWFRGRYRVIIERSELFEGYEGPEFSVSGWDEYNVEIILENRTLGSISGRVYGEGGFFEDGIPWAVVTLHHGDMMVMSTQADGSGNFLLEEIPDGENYTLTAAVPEAYRPEEGVRSGYLMNSTFNLSLEGYEVRMDLFLPYKDHNTSKWLYVIIWTPLKADVPLDEPIHIQFTLPVNITTAMSAIEVYPPLENISYAWIVERNILRIDHDPFLPMTRYTVEMRSTVLSQSGNPLFYYSGLEWNFTTGENVSTWRIHTAEVELIEMNLTVSVTGKENITVYMVITNVGSFLLEEGSNGTYYLLIPGHEFEYDTSYNYHFSSSVGGPDLVHALSGTFRTPEDPDPEPIWSLTSAEVEILERGTWNITAQGGENQSVYIVIEDVGSYLLVEDPPGTYTLLIGAEGFEGGDYLYHFSSEYGGVDLAPGLSGMRTVEPEGGGDDGDGPTQWIILLVLLMVIMGLIFVFVMVVRGKGDVADMEGDEE